MAFTKATLVLALIAPTIFAGTIPADMFRRTAAGSCQHGTRTTNNGQTYTVACDADRPGGDYKSLQAASFEACFSACTSDSGYCYLKNTLTHEAVAPGEATIVQGSGCISGPRTIGGRQCSVTCGTDYHGGDYRSSRLGSFEACAQACAADSVCKGAQYRESLGYCYMKNTMTSTFNVDSDVETIACS